jgi:hypothetical protein
MSSAGVSKADSLDSSETQPLWGSKPSPTAQCWAPSPTMGERFSTDQPLTRPSRTLDDLNGHFRGVFSEFQQGIAIGSIKATSNSAVLGTVANH